MGEEKWNHEYICGEIAKELEIVGNKCRCGLDVVEALEARRRLAKAPQPCKLAVPHHHTRLCISASANLKKSNDIGNLQSVP
jgi:hypothetical protein